MPASPTQQTRPSRLLSLDLLRGVTIAFMILVNNPGSENAYAPLKHAYWNGFTPTDLVFPTFLFIVGITTVFSLGSRIDRGDAKATLFLTVLRRAVLLYVIGVVISSFPFTDLSHIRYVGVLPRIALCYLAVGSLYLIDQGWRDKLVLLAVALVGYWALLRFVPVPGYGVPTHDIPLLDRDGNLAAWLDRQVFAPQHLYEKTRDPEGLLSTLPAIGTALLGVLAGIWLRTQRAVQHKIAGIAGAGTLGVLLGLLWNITLPINKKMWTSSYVLFAGGLSLLLLAAAMLLVDVPSAAEDRPARSNRSGRFTPLLVFGTNAIASYALADLLEGAVYSIHVSSGISLHRAIWRAIHRQIADPSLASLTYSVGFVCLCWMLIYLLYRRRIFLRI
jgi:predicted acyltransferase